MATVYRKTVRFSKGWKEGLMAREKEGIMTRQKRG